MIRAALVRSGRYLVDVYATADPRSLAAGRIALALVLLLDLVKRWEVLRDFYTNDGLLPNHTVLWRPTFRWVFSLFHLASWSNEAAIMFVGCGLAYLALLFGWHTRTAQVASFVAVLSLHGRTVFIQDGADVVLSELALWTIFLPTGRRYSIDALRNSPHEDALRDVRPITSLALAALTLQLGVIYLFNAIHKTGATWRSGTAVHYVLHQSGSVTALGVLAREHLPFALLRGMTKATLFLEWTLATLLLLPIKNTWTRRAAIVCAWVLHVGFALFLNLGVFVAAMLAYTPNLVTSSDWNALSRWRARRARRVMPFEQRGTILARARR